MSAFGDMKPGLANLALDLAPEIAKWLWHKLTGQNDDEESDAVKAIGAEFLAGALVAAQKAAEAQAAILGLPVELEQLEVGAESVVSAFEIAAGRRTVPVLNLQLEQVDELPTPLPSVDDFDTSETPAPPADDSEKP